MEYRGKEKLIMEMENLMGSKEERIKKMLTCPRLGSGVKGWVDVRLGDRVYSTETQIPFKERRMREDGKINEDRPC